MPFAIITGTGVTEQNIRACGVDWLEQDILISSYGEIPCFRNDGIIFINRHADISGNSHANPPHTINARAIIAGLGQAGVKRIGASYCVGAINQKYSLSAPILLSDFIDQTSGRISTFFSQPSSVAHVDMSQPFCPTLNQAITVEAEKIGREIITTATYICTNGPRLETPAEIRAYALMGADVVGMTLCPEIVLAREKGMSFVGLAYASNWAAGIEPSMKFDLSGLEDLKRDMLRMMIGALQHTKDEDCTPAALYTP